MRGGHFRYAPCNRIWIDNPYELLLHAFWLLYHTVMPSRSPSRAAQDTDERAYLLPPPNTDVSINPEATRSASGYSSWQFWRRDSTRARVTFADDDEHGEGLSTGGQPIKAKYLRWPLYVLLVLVGMAIGSLIRGGLPTKADSGMSKGPRVPPVEYLPPVSVSGLAPLWYFY